MKKTLCRYAIVRFAPYVETGEFANVGIVLVEPDRGGLFFKLETKRYGRVTRFFDDLDRKVYLTSVKNLEFELARIRALIKKTGNTIASSQFEEIVRPRETILRFSSIRTIIADNPAHLIEDLFGHYVERNFVTKEYKEIAMEKAVRGFLKDVNLDKKFSKKTLGDSLYEATFPFVHINEKSSPIVIKPVHLGHEKPSDIIELGLKWLSRISELRDRKILDQDILLTIDKPFDGGKAYDAYCQVLSRFEREDIKIAMNLDKDKIVKFAAKAI